MPVCAPDLAMSSIFLLHCFLVVMTLPLMVKGISLQLCGWCFAVQKAFAWNSMATHCQPACHLLSLLYSANIKSAHFMYLAEHACLVIPL